MVQKSRLFTAGRDFGITYSNVSIFINFFLGFN